MGSLRPNEELLLGTCKSVKELKPEELEKVGIRITKGISYRYDEEGNHYRVEEDCVKDEEFPFLVRVEEYHVATHLLGGVNLNIIEQVDIFPGGKTHKRRGKSRGRGRKGKDRGRRRGFRWGKGQKFICGTWRYAECGPCGYEYWKRVPCGREWCPECGKPESLYHRRLYLQMLDVVLRMYLNWGSVGYMVITCPEELREKWKDPKELRKFLNGLRRKLKDEGIWPVLYRWHWAGDRSNRWYPHLNLVFPGAYLEREELDRIKKYVERKGIKVVYYQYTRNLAKIRHLARYVSRPTWIMQNEVSPEKFKNFRKWGVWGGELLNRSGEDKEEEAKEFWKTLGAVVLAQLQVEHGWVGGIKEVKKVLEDLGIEDKVLMGMLEALEKTGENNSGEDLERVVKRVVERVLASRSGPAFEEIVGFTVLHGRCIGCFQKLKWKWRKSPFVSRDRKVFKVGWGCWVVVDKEYEDDFPF